MILSVISIYPLLFTILSSSFLLLSPFPLSLLIISLSLPYLKTFLLSVVFRGGSRVAATSKIELFVIIVNSWMYFTEQRVEVYFRTWQTSTKKANKYFARKALPYIFDRFLTLHKKWSFPLRISSVNVTKSAETADLVTFTEGKLHKYFSTKALFILAIVAEFHVPKIGTPFYRMIGAFPVGAK